MYTCRYSLCESIFIVFGILINSLEVVWFKSHLIAQYFLVLIMIKISKIITKLPHTTTILWSFFRDYPGKPVPEEIFWTLWCKRRLTEADKQTVRLGATPSGLTDAHLHHLAIFYRPDALPVAQPTVSKH